MKRFLIVLCMVTLLTSCGHKQKSCDSTCKDSTKTECVKTDSTKVDSTVVK